MGLKIHNYQGGYRIVSLAFDEETKNDLLSNEDLEVISVSGDSATLYPKRELIIVDEMKQLLEMNNYDVCEVWPDGRIFRCYDVCSIDNYFFVTGKCNSNCIMCPSADYSRKNGNVADIPKLIDIAKHIPSNAVHLTITGGEPFVAGEELFTFIEYLKEKFVKTEFLFLTNGRIFAVDSFVKSFSKNIPDNSILGIPVHGSCREIHDAITQTKGSFDQTISGIKKLLEEKIRVELRIVVSAINKDDISNIARLIVNEIPKVSYISIMAMEMTGSAFVNRDKVWIPYSEAFLAVREAVNILLNYGIDVKLYNFPLCSVKKEYWTLCEKSISPDKVRYSRKCRECTEKYSCGGVFNGTMVLAEEGLKPII